MGGIGNISVLEGAEPSIRVTEGIPAIVSVEDIAEMPVIIVSQDENDGLGNISVTEQDDYLLILVTADAGFGEIIVGVEDEQIEIHVLTGAIQVTSVSLGDIQDLIDTCEPSLGLPDGDDYYLTSKLTGERNWIPLPQYIVNLSKAGVTGAQVFDVTAYQDKFMIMDIGVKLLQGTAANIRAGLVDGEDDVLMDTDLSDMNPGDTRTLYCGRMFAAGENSVFVNLTGSLELFDLYLKLIRYKP